MSIESTKTSTGFKDSDEFSLHLESLKQQHGLESYIETVIWYVENESDIEVEDAVKFLNEKIIEEIRYEAQLKNLIKDNDKKELISLGI